MLSLLQAIIKYHIPERFCLKFDCHFAGLRIEQHGNRNTITDDLEGQCSWFGSTFQGHVVACSRMVHRDDSGQLDLTRYKDSEKPLTKQILSMQVNPRLYELQRIAISPLFRKTGIMNEIFKMAAQFVLEEESSLVGTSGSKSILKFVQQVGGLIIDDSFDYGDGNPVKLIYWPNGLIESIMVNMETKTSQAKRTGPVS